MTSFRFARALTSAAGLPLLAGLALLAGCSDDNDDSVNAQFEAELADISGYAGWTMVDATISDIPGLAGAHSGGDEAYTRHVYARAGADPQNGEYPEGAILVKETFTYDPATGAKVFAPAGGLLAMVKRGGDYNAQGGGWEWFMLESDASAILARGADLMDGACNACHGVSGSYGGVDHVFPHPAEVVADAASFDGYASWNLLEETDADHPFINPAHQSENGNALRRVYRRQLLANPADGGYPIGTLLVKEVEVEGEIVEITAMAKRGGEFDTANGDWEYFMLDPATGSVATRGAVPMCIACHAHATGGDGADFVFAHSGDPFNN